MYIHNFDPVIVNFGFIEIRWYSLAYIFGILLGWWLAKKILNYRSKSEDRTFLQGAFDDLIVYLILSIILGGRLGYVLFYNPNFYLNNLVEIIKVWEGGMSFHGALIGVIVGTFLFTKKRKIHTFIFLDVVACVAPIGLFFGRIANFINAELYGKPAQVFWSVIFPTVDNIPRHPSQIYEALLEGVLLFLILITFIYNRKIKIGMCSALFLIFYGGFRIIGEQFREPDEHIGYLFNLFSMGTLLSLIMMVIGFFLLLKINKNKEV